MDVNYINPFIQSAKSVFTTMLDTPLTRTGLSLKDTDTPSHDISAVIGLSGRVSGSVVFSLSRPVALAIVKKMIDLDVDSINAEVADAIAELVNMIAGGAKASFSHLQLSLGLPNVVVGRNHRIMFPGDVRPLCVDFHTVWGVLSLEVGFDDQSIESQPLEHFKFERST